MLRLIGMTDDAASRSIEITWTTDSDELASSARWTKWIAGVLGVATLAAIAATVWVFIHRDSAIPQWVLWLIPILGWFPFQWLRLTLRSRFFERRDAAAASPYRAAPVQPRVRFDETGMTGTLAGGSLRVPWTEVENVSVSDRSVRITYVSSFDKETRLLLVPRSAFATDVDLEQVRAWCVERGKGPTVIHLSVG
jgi:hypothetical protein